MTRPGHIILLLLLLTGAACTEEIDWELKYQESRLIVVEGKITSEAKAHEVKLTWPLEERNATPEPVSGAQVVINDRDSTYRLTEDRSRPGVYLTGPRFAGEVGKGYQLRIRYNNRIIKAVSFMREVRPFKRSNVRIYPVQQDPKLYEAFLGDEDGTSIVRMELDWSHVPGYDTLPAEETHALVYHYTLGSVDVNRIFAPDREHVRFPPGTIVFREKESVSREYEEFLRSMLSETDWRGGVFDVLPGNARSNFGDQALGYFTAADVIRDTVVID